MSCRSDFYVLAPEELAGRLFLGVFLLFLCYGAGFGFMQLKFPEKLFSKRYDNFKVYI